MVITRSMSAKLYDPNYTIEYTPNTYDPNRRISLVNEENIKNRSIHLNDMYDIYNDIKYKSKQTSGIIADVDLIPMLYSLMGIFYDKINNTKIKISRAIYKKKWISQSQLLKDKVLPQINDIDICFRQTGVNCGFGDFNKNNGVILCLSLKTRSSIYSQRLTPYDIKYMNLFGGLKSMMDEYISILKNAIKDNNSLENLFNEELCVNNFTEGSIYEYLNKMTNSNLYKFR